jgi:hypothetical protein
MRRKLGTQSESVMIKGKTSKYFVTTMFSSTRFWTSIFEANLFLIT